MTKRESDIHEHNETKVMVAPSGELILALPVYTTVPILDEDLIKGLTGHATSIGVMNKIGYIVFNPEIGEIYMNENIDDMFLDLGKL